MKGLKHSEETKRQISKSVREALRLSRWNREAVLDKLCIMLEEVQSDKYLTMGSYLREQGLHPPMFSYWARKFSGDKEVSFLVECIRSVFEDRLVIGGLKNKLNVAGVIFSLKNNYGYSDKQSIDLGVHRDELKEMSDTEIKERLVELKSKNERTN